MRLRIGLDMDGVIAEGVYIPPSLRRAEIYHYIDLIPGAVDTLLDLKHNHTVFIITSRNFGGAERAIKSELQGTNIARVFTDVRPEDKVHLARILKLDWYFDDRQDIICTFPGPEGNWAPPKGVVVGNGIPASIFDAGTQKIKLYRVDSIAHIPTFLDESDKREFLETFLVPAATNPVE